MREQIKRVLLTRILERTYPLGFRLVELQISRELKTRQAILHGNVRTAGRLLRSHGDDVLAPNLAAQVHAKVESAIS